MPGCPHLDILPAPELSQNYHTDKAMFNCISPKESGTFFIVCTIRFVGKGQNRRSPKSGSSDFASGTALLNYNPAAFFGVLQNLGSLLLWFFHINHLL